jgi:hypothetical protein
MWNKKEALTLSFTLEALVVGVLSAALAISISGSLNMEMMSYVYVFDSEYVTKRLRPTLRETSAMPCRSGYGDTSSSGLSIGLGLVLMADLPDPGP